MEIYAYFYIYELENGHRHQRFRNFINPRRIDKQDKKNIYIAIQKNDCGPLQYYLGRKIEYDRTKDTTKLNQKNHNEKTLEKFSLKESQVADMFTKSLDASKFIYTHK